MSSQSDNETSQKDNQLESCLALGLHPEKLTQAEFHIFPNQIDDYLAIRNRIVGMWYANPKQYLCGYECVKTLEEYGSQLVWFTFFWLQDQGVINWGFVRNPESVIGNKCCKDTQSLVERRALDILRTADLYTTTDKQIRRQIEAELGLEKEEYEEQIHETAISMVEYWCNFKNSQLLQQKKKPSVIVVGGGPSGMCAAQHLHNCGLEVTVLEARDRVGGRVHSYQGEFSSKVDLGASLITGTLPDTKKFHRIDPSTILCEQLGIQLHPLKDAQVPMYNTSTGARISKEVDDKVFTLIDNILTESQKLDEKDVEDKSLWEYVEEKLEKLKEKQRNKDISFLGEKPFVLLTSKVNVDDDFEFNDESERTIGWHLANQEYGFATPIDRVSLAHWYADERVNGGFGDRHCMVVGGYSAIFEDMAKNLNIKLNTPVKLIDWKGSEKVSVTSKDGEQFLADYAIISVPLGVLKNQTMEFQPVLPSWKQAAIKQLGFGSLNKIVLEFDKVFWDEDVDIIGMANGGGMELRGKFFMFWNLSRFTQKPMITSLIAGKAAQLAENAELHEQLRDDCLTLLRGVYGEDKVGQLKAWHVTSWSSEQYARGAYSFMEVGAKGNEYKQLAAPVEERLFFCGEHTVQGHCDTVGGAILSGLREASRIVSMVRGEGSGDDKVMAAQACNLYPSGQEADDDIDEDDASMCEQELDEKKNKNEKKRKRKEDSEKERASKKKKKIEKDEDGDGEVPKKQGRKRGKEKEEDGDGEAPKKRGRKRGKEREEKSPELPPQRLNQKDQENVAKDSRALLTAITEAKQGHYSYLIEWMGQAEGLLSRKTAVVVFSQADTYACKAIAQSLECLRILNTWVLDMHDLGKQGQDTLLNLLKFLAKLQPATNLLKESGLQDSVKERCVEHPKAKNMAHVASELLNRWSRTCKVDKPMDFRSKIRVSPLDTMSFGYDPLQLPQTPAPKQEMQLRTPSKTPITKESKPKEVSKKSSVKIEESGHLAKIQKQIQDYECKIKKLDEQIEKQSAQQPTKINLPKISEFEQFILKSDEKQKGVEHKGGKLKESGSGSSRSKEEVVDYIKEVLNPAYKWRKITKEDYKLICEKCVNKIKDSLEGGEFPSNYINENRKQRITSMVQKYISIYKKKERD